MRTEREDADPASRVRVLLDRVKYLQDRLSAEQRKTASLQSHAERWKRAAEQNYEMFVRTHSALNVLREDANRVLAEHGATSAHRELQELREKYDTLLSKRTRWVQFARQAVETKSHATRSAREKDEVIDQLRSRLEERDVEIGRLTRQSEDIVEQRDIQIRRFKGWCARWSRGEVGAVEVIAGLTGELGGYKMPDPDVVDRRRAVQHAETVSLLNDVTDQLGAIEQVLEEAGVGMVSTHTRQVRDMVQLYQGAMARIEELEKAGGGGDG